jgi:hypothetical protein
MQSPYLHLDFHLNKHYIGFLGYSITVGKTECSASFLSGVPNLLREEAHTLTARKANMKCQHFLVALSSRDIMYVTLIAQLVEQKIVEIMQVT